MQVHFNIFYWLYILLNYSWIYNIYSFELLQYQPLSQPHILKLHQRQYLPNQINLVDNFNSNNNNNNNNNNINSQLLPYLLNIFSGQQQILKRTSGFLFAKKEDEYLTVKLKVPSQSIRNINQDIKDSTILNIELNLPLPTPFNNGITGIKLIGNQENLIINRESNENFIIIINDYYSNNFHLEPLFTKISKAFDVNDPNFQWNELTSRTGKFTFNINQNQFQYERLLDDNLKLILNLLNQRIQIIGPYSLFNIKKLNNNNNNENIYEITISELSFVRIEILAKENNNNNNNQIIDIIELIKSGKDPIDLTLYKNSFKYLKFKNQIRLYIEPYELIGYHQHFNIQPINEDQIQIKIYLPNQLKIKKIQPMNSIDLLINEHQLDLFYLFNQINGFIQITTFNNNQIELKKENDKSIIKFSNYELESNNNNIGITYLNKGKTIIYIKNANQVKLNYNELNEPIKIPGLIIIQNNHPDNFNGQYSFGQLYDIENDKNNDELVTKTIDKPISTTTTTDNNNDDNDTELKESTISEKEKEKEKENNQSLSNEPIPTKKDNENISSPSSLPKIEDKENKEDKLNQTKSDINDYIEPKIQILLSKINNYNFNNLFKTEQASIELEIINDLNIKKVWYHEIPFSLNHTYHLIINNFDIIQVMENNFKLLEKDLNNSIKIQFFKPNELIYYKLNSNINLNIKEDDFIPCNINYDFSNFAKRTQIATIKLDNGYEIINNFDDTITLLFCNFRFTTIAEEFYHLRNNTFEVIQFLKPNFINMVPDTGFNEDPDGIDLTKLYTYLDPIEIQLLSNDVLKEMKKDNESDMITLLLNDGTQLKGSQNNLFVDRRADDDIRLLIKDPAGLLVEKF